MGNKGKGLEWGELMNIAKVLEGDWWDCGKSQRGFGDPIGRLLCHKEENENFKNLGWNSSTLIADTLKHKYHQGMKDEKCINTGIRI